MARVRVPLAGLFEIKRLDKIAKPPLDIPGQMAKGLVDPEVRKQTVKKMLTTGSVFDANKLTQLVSNALATSYYRRTFYRECEQAVSHPIVSGAIDLYVDSVTAVSPITNRSVWVVSSDKKLENLLNQFLDEIGIEEKIRDWAGQLAQYGDFFVEDIGRDGIGIAYVDDNVHPADMERLDVNGRLEGFIRTGLFSTQPTFTTNLEPPWQYVHFRTFGITRKVLNTALGIFGEPGRMFSLEQARLADKNFRVTTRYGTSILTPTIPIYKRLKLAEDSLLMSRMTRGVLYYMFKIYVSGMNPDAAAELVQDYAEYLKRSLGSGLDVTEGAREWKDKFGSVFGQIEDLFVPETDDVKVTFDRLGGEPDIKAIVDVKYLLDQLLMSLRVSRTMLGMCLRGDTKIKLLDGRDVPIKEIVDNQDQYIGKSIYACDRAGNVVARKIVGAAMTRPQTNFVRIHLDNGEHCDVTPDHPIMMRDGSFKEAQHLREGDSLMPLYTRYDGHLVGYEQYYNPSDNKWHYTHRMVAKQDAGLDKICRGYIVHHKDFDVRNNDPENLIIISNEDHMKLHDTDREGKSYEEIYGTEKARALREVRREQARTKNNFRSSWNRPWNRNLTKASDLRVADVAQKISAGYTYHINSGTFRKGTKINQLILTRTCPDCGLIMREIRICEYANHRANCSKNKVLNHKVVKVERLDIVEDAYDLQIENAYNAVNGGREHCFAIAAGIYIHNTDELPGGIGQSAAERLSINFAKNAQKLRIALRNGVKRLCQIHLAYLNQNPDPMRFDVNLTEISSAEEEEIKDALDKGVDIVDKMLELFDKVGVTTPEQKLELVDYLNRKILKLDDLDLKKLVKSVMGPSEESQSKTKVYQMVNSDLLSYLPGSKIYRLDENFQAKEEKVEWKTMQVEGKNDDAKNNGSSKA